MEPLLNNMPDISVFEKYAQLQLREPISHAPMHAETERNMCPGIRAVDDESVRFIKHCLVAVAGQIPHDDLITLSDSLTAKLIFARSTFMCASTSAANRPMN